MDNYLEIHLVHFLFKIILALFRNKKVLIRKSVFK